MADRKAEDTITGLTKVMLFPVAVFVFLVSIGVIITTMSLEQFAQVFQFTIGFFVVLVLIAVGIILIDSKIKHGKFFADEDGGKE